MKRLILLVLLVSTPAYAWVIEDYTLDFRTSCVASGKTICVNATNYTDYFTTSNGAGDGTAVDTLGTGCPSVYRVAGLNNISFGSEGMSVTTKAEDIANPLFDASSTHCNRKTETYHYTGARLQWKTYCKYCQYDIKAKTPIGAGLWSSIWSIGQNTDRYGEVDMIEQLGKWTDKKYQVNFHWRNVEQTANNDNPVYRYFSDINTAFHTYSLVLGGEHISSLTDDVLIDQYRRNKICNLKENGQLEDEDCGTTLSFDQPFTIIISSNGGGPWAGDMNPASVPASMVIESIKVSKLDPNVKNAGFPVTASPTDYLQ